MNDTCSTDGLSVREWEFLQAPLCLEAVELPASFPIVESGRVVLKRGPKYDIEGELALPRLFSKKLNLLENDPIGTLSFGINLAAKTLDQKFNVTVNNASFNKRKWPETDVVFSFDSWEVHFQAREPMPVSCSVDWYLNGASPEEVFDLPKATYESNGETKIVRGYLNQELEKTARVSSHSYGCLKGVAEGFSFLIFQVDPKHYGVEWSKSVGIEFREKWGGIPDAETREAICEFASFIFGRQLLYVGSSDYDAEECFVSGVCQQPWGRNARDFCENLSEPPLQFDHLNDASQCSRMFNELLPAYLKLRKPYRLDDALWEFWVAQLLPVENTIVCFKTSLEILHKGWCGAQVLPRDHKKTKPEELLKFLGLRIGKYEKQAIAARHEVVHGDPRGRNVALFEKDYWHSQVLKTLFHRVFLKLLGYDGNYTNYAVPGYPAHPISSPITRVETAATMKGSQ